MQDIAQLYQRASSASSYDAWCTNLQGFVDANENPSTSPNFQCTETDPVHVFIAALHSKHTLQDPAMVLLLLKSLKILSRKQANRLQFGEDGLRAVLQALLPPLTPRIAAEGANVILNVCYEVNNVTALLKMAGIKQLISFLSEQDSDLQANAAGAIQSVCYQKEGRKAVRELDGVQSLLMLLSSENTKVLTRAAGAIHNLSLERDSIIIIRRYGGIPRLVALLGQEATAIAGSAAGALQNVAREVASRMLIRELDAVPPLARLLSTTDLHAQVCAAGALLNIMGPDIDELPNGKAKRRALGSIMSQLMAVSVIFEGLFQQVPPLE